MPTFTTPEPIAVELKVSSGRVVLVASDRTDTAVRVESSDESEKSAAAAAEKIYVDYAGGKLVVGTPARGLSRMFDKDRPVDLVIELPTGSTLDAESARAEIRSEGRLGECHLQTASGPVQLDRTGSLQVETSDAPITVECVTGYAKVDSSSGKVRLREIDGSAVVKSANGDIWVGSATQDLNLSASNGNIFVDRAGGSVSAKTSTGNVRLGEVVLGQVEMMTGAGELEVGIGAGSAAWIDAHSKTGSVHNSLDVHDSAEQFANTVKVHARTHSGDIMIRRAPQHVPSQR